MSEFTVIICTHNPRKSYFSATMKGLRAQTFPMDRWELLIIDNASEEGKKPECELGWHPNARVLIEEKLGLTPARLRGIREAKGEILLFVDDDNILDPDFLEEAARVAVEKPFLGAWSGQTRGVFDEPPPEWTRRYWGNLAIREFSEDRWSNLPRLAETMPCGAGLCVRRPVASHYLELNESGVRGFQFDRTGESLVSGGDNDLAGCACDVGLSVGIISAMKLQHLMPPGRLTEDYLSRLAEGISFSSILLDDARGVPVHPRSRVRRIVDSLRLILLKRPHKSIQRAALLGADRAVNMIRQTS
jgi:glycosyltransferase involved in cell wall biosynthesis